MQIFAWVQERVQSPNDNAVAPEDLQAREECLPRDFVAQVDSAPCDVVSFSETVHPITVDLWQLWWPGGIRPAVVALQHPIFPQRVDILFSDADDLMFINTRFVVLNSVHEPGPHLGIEVGA